MSFGLYIIILCGCSYDFVNARLEKAAFQARTGYISDFKSVDTGHYHNVIFAIKQMNMKYLEEALFDVSDPKSSHYGKHMNRNAIAKLSGNPIGRYSVIQFLQSNNIQIVNQTLHGEFITARASIEKWQKVFSNQFYKFSHISGKYPDVVRALYYNIPDIISEHVITAFNVIHLPLPKHKSSHILTDLTGLSASDIGVTPKRLNEFYHISSNTGSMSVKQTIYSSANQYFSSDDLRLFQSMISSPNHPIDFDLYNRDNSVACDIEATLCEESNLDVQYLTAIAQNTTTEIIYDSSDDYMVAWITGTAEQPEPSSVQSISYGYQESDMIGYESYLQLFNEQAIKLGLMGVTIVAASGDDGVAGFHARHNISACGYDASFPASSPYVVAVGATQGLERGKAEKACMADSGGGITSGGGFSLLNDAPSFQHDAVESYFNKTEGQLVSGYRRKGRALPDVSLAGAAYITVLGGRLAHVSGTSASTPVFAGMISLVNAARIATGKSTLGYLNPGIYTLGESFTNDITEGSNHCPIHSGCCLEGFPTTTGWDPVTGFGSVDFAKFHAIFQ